MFAVLSFIFTFILNLWLLATTLLTTKPTSTVESTVDIEAALPTVAPAPVVVEAVKYSSLPRHARARNTKTRARMEQLVKKAALAARLLSVSPLTPDSPSPSSDKVLDISLALPMHRSASPPVSPRQIRSPPTPGLSPTPSSPTSSAPSSPPSTPCSSGSVMPGAFSLYDIDEEDEEGDLEEGGRGERFIKEPFRAIYGTLLSPTVSKVSGGLPDHSARVVEAADPFARNGESWFAEDANSEVPYPDVFDFSLYEDTTDVPIQDSDSSTSIPFSSPSPKVQSTTWDSAPVFAVLISPAQARDVRVKARPAAERRRAVYQANGALAQPSQISSPSYPPSATSSPSPSSVSASFPPSLSSSIYSCPPPSSPPSPLSLSRSSSTSSGTSTPTRACVSYSTESIKDAEELRDREFLRALARAQFQVGGAKNPSVLASVFSDRRSSGHVNIDESTMRKREHMDSVQEKRRSQQLEEIVSLLDGGERRESVCGWNVDLEGGEAVEEGVFVIEAI
ncbi:hypothetical protein EVG20_g2136 [Dentipellis fragilis]|uniref:Uncharacterized protein n=1 Tax=Dentipellis fragilis TaxID=205917 RepID=A0A4Y9ZAP2_9AGAM|nr:hypothetical protein EVG20_g2136 [Dentipellis fragilis]